MQTCATSLLRTAPSTGLLSEAGTPLADLRTRAAALDAAARSAQLHTLLLSFSSQSTSLKAVSGAGADAVLNLLLGVPKSPSPKSIPTAASA